MNYHYQLAKKGVSDSLGLVDFTIRQVKLVLNLPDKQVTVFREFKLQKNRNQSYLSKNFSWLVRMTFGIVHASYSLPKWQAVKLTFFSPCIMIKTLKTDTIITI